MHGHTMPIKDEFSSDKEIRKGVSGQNHVNFKFGGGFLWEGKRKEFSCWH
jgi:hypothetical protein